jgi:hypothetical protein
VLDFFGCEHAKAFRAVVYTMPRARDAAERALVVLGLEAEVSLAHDDDFGVDEAIHAADAIDVPMDECELLARICTERLQLLSMSASSITNYTN